MKLSEIARHTPRASYALVAVEPAEGQYGVFDVEVKFHYDAPSSTRHGDNSSFDEDHPAEIDILTITLNEPVEEHDDDGALIKTWPKGTNVESLPWWDKTDDEFVIDKLYDNASKRDDFDD